MIGSNPGAGIGSSYVCLVAETGCEVSPTRTSQLVIYKYVAKCNILLYKYTCNMYKNIVLYKVTVHNGAKAEINREALYYL